MSGFRRNTLIPFRVQSRLSLSPFGDSPPAGGFPFLPTLQPSTVALLFAASLSRRQRTRKLRFLASYAGWLRRARVWRQQPAALTHAFPAPRAAASYILDTFPIVKRKDEAKFNGDYRTKRVILEIYDALTESMQTRKVYQTQFDPPPADARCCHPARTTDSEERKLKWCRVGR